MEKISRKNGSKNLSKTYKYYIHWLKMLIYSFIILFIFFAFVKFTHLVIFFIECIYSKISSLSLLLTFIPPSEDDLSLFFYIFFSFLYRKTLGSI